MRIRNVVATVAVLLLFCSLLPAQAIFNGQSVNVTWLYPDTASTYEPQTPVTVGSGVELPSYGPSNDAFTVDISHTNGVIEIDSHRTGGNFDNFVTFNGLRITNPGTGTIPNFTSVALLATSNWLDLNGVPFDSSRITFDTRNIYLNFKGMLNQVGMKIFIQVNNVAITTTSLPNGVAGTLYSKTVTASGTAGTLTWSASGLPTGISMNATTGVLSGTPTQTGNFNVVINVTDAGNGSTATTTLPLTILQASTTSLTPNPTSSTFGQTVTLTATVAPSAATGTITFKDGATTIGTGTLSGGTASMTTSTLTVGSHSLTAVYGGDSSVNTSTSSATTFTVGLTPTSVTLTRNFTSPTTIGRQNLTLNATITGAATGRVTFFDGPTPLGTASVIGVTAAINLPMLGVGAHKLRAYFQGDATTATSTSAVLAHTVVSSPQSGFVASVGYATGAAPWGVAQIDYNLDGRMDVAVANFTGSTVQLYLNLGNGTFTSGPSIAVAAGPISLATGDFNNDGFIDLAVACYNADTVSILPGNGTGFAAPVPITTGIGSLPEGIAVADFNGDGLADMAVANNNGNNVSVLLGNGANGFTPAAGSPIAVGTHPGSIFTADFNGDGKADLITPNFTTNNISVLLGLGGGTFAAAVNYPTGGTNPYQIALADLNNDGNLDVIAAHNGSANVGVLLGTASGTFGTATLFNSLANEFSVVAGDFNGDGNLDVLVSGGATGDAQVLTGNGTGTLTAGATVSATAGTLPSRGLLVADFNGDGIEDALMTHFGSNALSVALGVATTTTTLTSSVNPSTVGQAVTLTATISTFNATGTVTFKDGATTIGTSTVGSCCALSPKSAELLLDPRGGLGTPTATLTVSNLAVGIHTLSAIYNGDTLNATSTSANLSQVVTLATSTTSLSVAPSTPAYLDPVTLTASVTPSTATGTVTFKDGATTIGTGAVNSGVATLTLTTLSASTHSLTAIYGGDSGTQTSTSSAVSLTVSGGTTTNLTIAPSGSAGFGKPVTLTATVAGATAGRVTFYDGTALLGTAAAASGTATLITSGLRAGSHSLRAYYQGLQGSGPSLSAAVAYPITPVAGAGFATPTSVTAGASPYYTITADFNRDGSMDFAVANYADSTVGVYLNSGNGTFSAPATYPVGGRPTTLAMVDYNNDGVQDLLAACESPSVLTVLPGGANGTFGTAVNFTSGVQINPEGVAVADFNGDGLPDLAVTSTANSVSVLLGNNASNFVPAAIYTVGQTPVFVIAGDVNGDGITDLVTANLNGSSASVLLGQGGGVFAAAVDYTVGGGSTAQVALADVNVDGKLDLLAVNAANSTLGLLTGTGTGTFNAVSTLATGAGPTSLALADFDGDGTPDLAIGNDSASNVTVMKGTGTSFSAGVVAVTATGGARGVSVADFNGDGVADLVYANPSGSKATVALGLAAVTTTLTSSPNPSTVGQSVTLTATVSPVVAGNITFKDGANTIGTVALVNGTATLNTVALFFGTHSLTATYPGNATTAASTSPAVTQTVNQGSTTTTLTSSANPSVFGQSITLTATMGTNTATGTITFKEGATTLGTGTLAGGIATLTTSALTAATHSLTAVYGGDTNYTGNTSNTLSLQVNQALPTVTITSSANPSTYGQSVTFTATISDTTATGTATFYNFGELSIGSGNVVNGVATFTTTTLPAGVNQITGYYNGDANFQATGSSSLAQTVNAVGSTTTLSVPSTSTYFSLLQVTATVTPSTATGIVDIFDGTTLVGSASLVNGVVTTGITPLAVGTHSLTANYKGNGNVLTSTSSAVTHTVTKATPTVSMFAAPFISAVGQAVTLTVAMNFPDPTGTITFKDGSTTLGTATPTNGLATLVTSAIPAGTRTLTAVYGGDSNYNTATSSPTNQTVYRVIFSDNFNTAPSGSWSNTFGSWTAAGGVYDATAGSPSPNARTFLPNVVSDFTVHVETTKVGDGGVWLRAVNNGVGIGASGVLFIIRPSSGDMFFHEVANGVYGPGQQVTPLSAGPHSFDIIAAGSGYYVYVDGATTPAVSFVSSQTFSGLVGLYDNGPLGFDNFVLASNGTTTTLTSSPNPSTFGQTVTLTANVSPSSATGSVQFFDGSTSLGTASLASGVASLNVASLAIGSHVISADYSGDSLNDSSFSADVTLVVNQGLSTTSLTVSPNPSSFGQSVTLTATVAAAGATGTVTFKNGTTTLGTSPLSGGVATFTTSTLPVGSSSLTALYGGDSIWAASSSNSVSAVVNPAASTTTLSSSANPIAFGSSVTFTATVSPSGATGNIQFLDGSTVLTTVALSSGTASYTTSALAVGSHSITAVYEGDGSYGTSSSTAVTQTVNQLATTTSLTSSPNPSNVLSSVTLTATVTPSTATGNVSFKTGSTVIGSAPLSGGTATLTTTGLALGSQSLTAVYSGDINNATSTSPAVSHTVQLAPTTITVSSSLNPSTFQQQVMFTATVSPSGASGTVAFFDGSTQIGTGNLSGGIATFPTIALGGGSHVITASYSGDSQNAASTSSPLSQLVNQAVTTTTLTSTPNPSVSGQNVTLTAILTPSTTLGTVTFKDGATVIGTGSLSNGAATLSTIGLATGTHSLTAEYAGNADSVASTSAAVTQTVNQTATTLSLTSAPATSTFGQNVVLTASITPSGTAGVISFKDGTTVIGSASLASGSASLTVNSLAVGSHSLTAFYAGDANTASAVSQVVTQTVNPAAVTVSLSSSLNPAVVGTSVSLAASVTPVTGTHIPTGTITFKDGAITLTTVSLVNGTASFSTSALSPGTHTLTATYNGDANDLVGTSNTLSQTVQQAATTTSLTVGPNPVIAGSTVTMTVQVVSAVAGNTPTGSVQFLDGQTILGTVALSAGSATFQTSTLAPGSHVISATYGGDSSNAASTNINGISLNFATHVPGTILDRFGNGTGFTTRLPGTGTSIPTNDSGLVADVDLQRLTLQSTNSDLNGGGNLGVAEFPGFPLSTFGISANQDFSLSATFRNIQYSAPYDQVGVFVGTGPTASVRGGVFFNGTPNAYTVNNTGVDAPPQMSTALAPAAGEDAVITVSRTSGVWQFSIQNLTTPSRSGAIPITQPTFLNNVSGLVAGIFATNSGNAFSKDQTVSSFQLTGAPITLLVNQIVTTTTLTSSANPASVGQNITLTATVSPVSAGTVTFKDGATTIGTGTLTNGVATMSTGSLAIGLHSLTAVYGGNASAAGSTSAALNQSVGLIVSTTVLTSSTNPATVGQGLTLRATVTPSNATGNVTFLDGTTVLGTGTLINGSATLVANLTAGLHSLTAQYGGSASVAISTSAVLAQQVVFPPLTISSPTIPAGQVGAAYGPVGFSAQGGSGLLSWTASGLPAGLSMSTGGSISGTPTTPGTFTGSVTVNDSVSGQFTSASVTISIAAATLSLTGPQSLGNVLVGGTIGGTFTVSGGKPPYSWTISGAPGASIDANGKVSGAASSAGAFTASIVVTDSLNTTAGASAALTVLGLTTASLPPAQTIANYSATITAIGGIQPYTFTITGLPAGLTASGASITGRPTSPGTSQVTVKVSDSGGLSLTTTFSLAVTGNGPLQVTSSTLPDGTVKQAYSQSVSATGGTPPYTYSQTGGVLPAGLSLGSTGTIFGTPTSPGPAIVGFQVSDSAGGTASGTASITIKPEPFQITNNGNLPAGIAGIQYQAQTLAAAGGIAPYTFAVKGTLPGGITLTNGQISGTPSAAGTFNFSVTATDSSDPALTANAALSLTVRPPAPDLVISASGADFELTAGSTAAPPPNLVSVSSSVASETLTYSTSVAPAASWLSVTSGGSTPGSLSIGLTQAALNLTAAGSPYSATISVNCTSTACAGKSQSIAVVLKVKTAPPQLSVGSSLISFTATAANPQPAVASLDIQNSGGGSLAGVKTASDATWLTVGQPPASILPGPGAQVIVTANPAGLGAGYYRATIAVTSSVGNANVPVTLLVTQDSSMTLSAGGTQLSMQEGGAVGNPNGSFLVSVNSVTAVPYTISTQPGSPWLVASGTGSAGIGGPGTASYSINATEAAALKVGTYYGTVRVSATGVVNSPQDYQVILTVTPNTQPVVPDPQPAGLIFTTTVGGTTPGAQTVTLFASSKTAVTYQAGAAVLDGSGNWLSVTPTGGTTSATSPAQLRVTVNPTGLKAGVYRGGISVSYAGTAVRTVNITLLVQASGNASLTSSNTRLEPRADCAGGQLVPTQTGLVSSFAAPASWPTPLAIRLLDTCGSVVAGGQVVTTFSNGDPPLALTMVDAKQGLYTATWTPRKTTAQVTITARATAVGYAAATAQIGGQVTPNEAPVLEANGTQDVFNPQLGGGLGPGNIVQIYGKNLAALAQAPTQLPLPTTVSGTKVLIGGVLAPLFYVSSKQVNAQVPFELTPGKQYQLVVSANGALTTPQPIQLNAGTPATLQFTSGLIIAQHQDGSLILENSPAKPGEFIVFYMSGLGATDIEVPSGQPSPADPPARVKDIPTVTLNGAEVTPAFVGLTPGLVGLYQINVKVPETLADGSYKVKVTQNGTEGNTTTLIVKK